MSQTAQITPDDIVGMVRHWLTTPVEGYLGSPYGSDVRALLQRPQGDSAALADFVAKMRRDLPVLSVLPEGAVSVSLVPRGVDGLELNVDVAGRLIRIGGQG